jgi:hypothetical protein
MGSASHTNPEIDFAVDIPKPVTSEIAGLAYQLWEERGCPLGSPEQDWFLAESELSNRQSVSVVAA